MKRSLAAALIVWVASLGCGKSGTSGNLFSGGAGGAGAGGSGAGASGGEGGAPPTCDPSAAVTACDTCVFDACCAEEALCEAGTKCGDLLDCAGAAGCFDPAQEFLPCAVDACPMQATESAVSAYNGLAECIQGNCKAACQ